MDNKELQKTVNPVYLTAKSTLGLLKKAGDPDAVALLPIIGLETELQEKAKILPAHIGDCYKTAQLARLPSWPAMKYTTPLRFEAAPTISWTFLRVIRPAGSACRRRESAISGLTFRW